MFRPIIPSTSGGRPPMVIIRRSITRKSVLDSGSVRVFTLAASSAASDGAVGAGGPICSTARSFRNINFSIAMVSITSTTEPLEATGGSKATQVSKRTIPGTSWEFLTLMRGWQAASAEPAVQAGDLLVARLADERILAVI